MLEVHAPHEAAHTWKGFLIHIATIVIGLFIAVSLEQTVEYFHHRHLRAQLEEQMQQVFAGNLQSDATSIQQLTGFRGHLAQIRAAILGRLNGKQEPPMPPANDPLMTIIPTFPTLAPYDAAKENGTVAYLPVAGIRLYNRVAFQRELAAIVQQHWFERAAAFAAFNERYTDSTGNLEMGGTSIAPDLTNLSHAELTEYLSVVAALIKYTDLLSARFGLFDSECRAILAGVPDEEAMIRTITHERTRK
jgi:hypothetical protein